MNFTTKLFSAAAVLALTSAAYAAPIVTLGGTAIAGQGLTTSLAGMAVIDFNGGALPSGVTVTAASTNYVTGNLVNIYAAPPSDSSQYLAVGPTTGSPVTITYAAGADYIGFYASSLDAYNTIRLVSGTTTVTYTGSQLAAFAGIPADGNQTLGYYFNITDVGNIFTSVILESSVQALELDNFAIGRRAEVPLPGSLALVLGAMGAGLVLSRKKQK